MVNFVMNFIASECCSKYINTLKTKRIQKQQKVDKTGKIKSNNQLYKQGKIMLSANNRAKVNNLFKVIKKGMTYEN